MPEMKKPQSTGKPDKVPLWQKIYSREHYADVVRMVGYKVISLSHAEKKPKSCCKNTARKN